jgi:hypothetical protein
MGMVLDRAQQVQRQEMVRGRQRFGKLVRDSAYDCKV